MISQAIGLGSGGQGTHASARTHATSQPPHTTHTTHTNGTRYRRLLQLQHTTLHYTNLLSQIFRIYIEGKLKTVVIQIGNSDDKLSQREWSGYVNDVGEAVDQYQYAVHFSGGPSTSAYWQNYCWVLVVRDEDMVKFFERLQVLRKCFKQDSIAVTIGDTQFMEG